MSELHQLSGNDAGMVFVESGATPNHIAPAMICDPSSIPGGEKLRLNEIKARIDQALDQAPAFRRKLVRAPMDLDDPYWVDDPTFDLDFHVRHMALPQPGDHRQLAIQIARLLSRPLDMNRPLWEVYVIEGLDRIPDLPKGSFAVLFKIHHAMIDGVGAIALMSGILDTSPVPPPESHQSNWRPQPGPNISEMLTRSWLHSVTRPGRLMQRIGNLVPVLARQRKAVAGQEPPVQSGRMAPKTPFNGAITAARVYDWREYPLDEIKQLRSLAPGSTVNDLALAFCTGSLRRYLLAKNALPDANLLAAVPVSLRTEATKNNAAGNEISILTVPLPTTIADPIERLQLIRDQMAQKKHPSRAMSARAISELSAAIPGRVSGMLTRALTQIGNRSGRPMANTFLSNVPGFTEPMYFCGARVVNMFGGGPVMSNMGLAHIVGSYANIFNINMIGCRDLAPDIDVYARCVEESVAEYRELYAASQAEPGGAGKSSATSPSAGSNGSDTAEAAAPSKPGGDTSGDDTKNDDKSGGRTKPDKPQRAAKPKSASKRHQPASA